MSIHSTLIKIGSTDITSYLKAPGGYKVQRNKLYNDAGRNMAGELRTTLIGIFPKLLLNFRVLTQAEMSTIISLLDEGSFSVEWWDEKSDSLKTGDFYAGDYDISIYRNDNGTYENFTVNLIAFSKLL